MLTLTEYAALTNRKPHSGGGLAANGKSQEKQIEALEREARKIGIPMQRYFRGPIVSKPEIRKPTVRLKWRHEFVTVKGCSQHRYRDVRTGRFIKKV